MTGRIAMPPVAEDRNRRPLPLGAVRQVLDILEKSLVVADRSGGLVLVNARARRCLETQGFTETDELNLFSDLLKMDAADIFRQVERSEEHTSELQSQSNLVCRLLLEKKNTASIHVYRAPIRISAAFHHKSTD